MKMSAMQSGKMRPNTGSTDERRSRVRQPRCSRVPLKRFLVPILATRYIAIYVTLCDVLSPVVLLFYRSPLVSVEISVDAYGNGHSQFQWHRYRTIGVQ